MAIQQALSGEVIVVWPHGSTINRIWSSALYKTQHLEMFRMILLGGNEIPEHEAVGELTEQCLVGRADLSIGTARDIVRPGDLKCLARGIPHWLAVPDIRQVEAGGCKTADPFRINLKQRGAK